MKILLAVNYEELEDYISDLEGIEVVNIARDRSTLLTAGREHAPRLLLLADELPGDEDMRELIANLTKVEFQKMRIIYLLSDDSEKSREFAAFLISKGIYDFHMGLHIDSEQIKSLVFSPALRNQAIERLNVSSSKSLKSEQMPKSSFEKVMDRVIERPRRTVVLKEMDSAVITMLSNHSTGKSHTAWNLAYCLSERGYRTSVFNIDRGYSANIYYGINEAYHELLDYCISNGKYSSILENCFKRKNLNIISGRLGDEKLMAANDFLELLFYIRAKSEITIIDTCTGANELTKLAIKNSTIDFLIFDSDLMHFHLNKLMLEELGEGFIPQKTFAVINNCDTDGESYKYIYEQISGLGLEFKGIIPISSCNTLGCDMMHTSQTAYQAAGELYGNFKKDMDNLLIAMNSREKKSILKKWFKA